jgi:hypothetical protein
MVLSEIMNAHVLFAGGNSCAGRPKWIHLQYQLCRQLSSTDIVGMKTAYLVELLEAYIYYTD